MSLSATTVAITGAAGGLGKAIANTYLEAGANVAICDVNQDRLTETENAWSQTYSGKYLTSKTDITDEAATESFIDSVVSKFGKLDILVNNAGLMDTFDPVGSTSKASWDRIMAVNVTGLFLASKAAINAMLKTGGGTIISIGSNASERGFSAGAAYTASKHALLGLTRNTAGFYGDQGVYSIALLLGGMEDTNIADNFRVAGMNQQAYGQVQAANPGYVAGKTKVELGDVAKYCVFLADRAVAGASNGSTITVNKNWPYA
jgi:NAD(P)-dependent dehydrogenase (short-subunit alcohol dehydrogenase family)